MARYSEGDVVRANVDAQGLAKGEAYLVLQAKELLTPFGDFVTYSVSGLNSEATLQIQNGHLLLDPVEMAPCIVCGEPGPDGVACPCLDPPVCPHGCGPCACGSGDPSCLCRADHESVTEEKHFLCGCTVQQSCPEHAR